MLETKNGVKLHHKTEVYLKCPRSGWVDTKENWEPEIAERNLELAHLGSSKRESIKDLVRVTPKNGVWVEV